MQNEVNLKSKNTALLWIFLAANVIIILTIRFSKFFERFDVILWTKAVGANIQLTYLIKNTSSSVFLWKCLRRRKRDKSDSLFIIFEY